MQGTAPKGLAVDIGGTTVEILATGQAEPRTATDRKARAPRQPVRLDTTEEAGAQT
jgi:hypothetical protein